MAFKKINPSSKTNSNTGFGTQVTQIGGRFINKDGSFNLRKEGWPFLKRENFYSNLLAVSNGRFLLIVVGFYFGINSLFTLLYLAAGYHQLHGLMAATNWGRIKEIFYFSTQTFTTVGYGRINPLGDIANIIASLESMTGLLTFAVITGLLYGRFTRPKAFLAFSDKALMSPYKDGVALMFRMVPYKSRHYLSNANIMVTAVLMVTEDEKPQFKFFPLKLERSHIEIFNMNWTVVHPIDEESPFYNFTKEDMERSDMELYIQINGFDQVFSNTVMQQTSYVHDELVWGAKFLPMYRESEDNNTTILELDKLDLFEKVSLGQKTGEPAVNPLATPVQQL